MQHPSARDLVLRSLVAISAERETEFYANIFQSQDPERFAMILLDPRCLLNPLLKSLISDLKILSNLNLTPIMIVGALNNDRSQVSYHTQKLVKELENAGIQFGRLNCASYELVPHVQRTVKAGKFPVLELTNPDRGLDLTDLVTTFQPSKVIILQPSGGLRENGERIPVLKVDEISDVLAREETSAAQNRALAYVRDISAKIAHRCTYVMASPLNLLAELFTVKGSGTLIRNSAEIKAAKSYRGLKKIDIKVSIESAFERTLSPDFFKHKPTRVLLEKDYRGGAVFFTLSGLPYMSKFWVTREAQGEGIASDIWQSIVTQTPAFFWRSRKENPFNDWYMKLCDGMQVHGAWRVFWKGLSAAEIPGAISSATNAPIDFSDE